MYPSPSSDAADNVLLIRRHRIAPRILCLIPLRSGISIRARLAASCRAVDRQDKSRTVEAGAQPARKVAIRPRRNQPFGWTVAFTTRVPAMRS